MTHPSRMRRAAAWGVHLYTALGLPLAFVAAVALAARDARLFFIALWLAVAVDATDGFLARAVDVRRVLPEFDGRRLDDLIDFLTYAFLPALSFAAFGMLPTGLEAFAVVPLVASGYGFCQDHAKTEDAFVGFPSYWNVVALYIYVLAPDPRLSLALLLVLSALVFVPIHYLYPTRTRLLQRTTLILLSLWGAAVFALAWWPEASWGRSLALWSLTVPLYYFVISGIHHRRVVPHERAK